ncbi:MAG: SDR family NAD(P)-dependent oxidoreductase [Promethearchaeota archaeon]|jgi:NAD(P)-dependent dehydrogenase (short-subunit alcohol dehydrogenase family)
MIKDLKEKVAVITGAGSGIGLSMARAFAKQGMKVVIADINESALSQASRELENSGADILSLVVDVSKEEKVEDLAKAAYEKYGKVNVLCNNAGVGGGAPPHVIKTGNWNFTLGPNLFGVIYGIQSFVKRMFDSKEPCHIVNTASVAGHLSGEGGPYAVSKFGVVAMSEWLLVNCFNTNVGVSVLCPGLVDTKIIENSVLLSQNLTDAYQPSPEEIAASQPYNENFVKLLGLGMSPDKVADMVIYAIQNDLFFIMTHPQYVNLIEARLNKIKDDAAIIRENFPMPAKEKKMNSYEYKSEMLNFSISYPDYLIPINPDPLLPFLVFSASKEFLINLQVNVSEIVPNQRLEDMTQALANILKNYGSDVKITSDKQITLPDGTIAREGEIMYQRIGYVETGSHHIAVIKDNKVIRVSIYAHPSFMNDELKKIGYSLKIDVPLAEVH